MEIIIMKYSEKYILTFLWNCGMLMRTCNTNLNLHAMALQHKSGLGLLL
jgi:hypothetical protein